MSGDLTKQLHAPFDEQDIEWRVQSCGISNQNPWVRVIPYITNRAVMKRLDEVFGIDGWENQYKPAPSGKGFLCGLTVHTDKRSITRWDGADETQVEALKGALSDSMKRAAVHFGIGRYLYQLDVTFADAFIVNSHFDAPNVTKEKKTNTLIGWRPPALPYWAKPKPDTQKFKDAISNSTNSKELKIAFTQAYRMAESQQDSELLAEFTQLKDKKKSEFEAKETISDKERLASIEKGVNSSIATMKQLPTSATVSNYLKKEQETIKLREQEFGVSLSHLHDKLNQAANEKLKGLKK